MTDLCLHDDRHPLAVRQARPRPADSADGSAFARSGLRAAADGLAAAGAGNA